jgi:hypothetical protein
MWVIILIVAGALLATGYLRTVIQKKQPGFVLDVQSVLKGWISENKWMSYFSPLFVLPLFLYNVLAFTVYGILSVVDLFALVFSGIWWCLRWFWFEVLNPTIIALLRLIWHYIFVSGFRLFQFSIQHITESYRWKNFVYAFKLLILPVLVTVLLLIAYLLTHNIVVLVLSLLAVFFIFQYCVYISLTVYRYEDFEQSMIFPGLKITLIWLGLASLSTALLVLLSQFSEVYIVKALSITLIQFLLPVAVIFGFAFLLTSFYLPAYMAETGGEHSIRGFWSYSIRRIPKFVYAQPFHLIGLAITALLPVVLLVLLNAGLSRVTGNGFLASGKDALAMDYHIPSIIRNNSDVKSTDSKIARLKTERDSLAKTQDAVISELRAEISDASRMQAEIKDRKIHTFNRKAYVGEFQSFSIPEIEGADDYQWTVSNATNKALVRYQKLPGGKGSGSSVLYHQWKTPGKYILTVVLPKGSGDGVNPSIEVEVLPASDSIVVPDTRYFVTREAAGYALELLQNQLLEKQGEKKSLDSEFSKKEQVVVETRDHLRFLSNEHIHMLISKIVTLLGLGLLAALMLSVLWPYCVTWYFDLYEYNQEGKHFATTLLDEIRAQNPNQPLLGIFVLSILGVIVWLTVYCKLLPELFNYFF